MNDVYVESVIGLEEWRMLSLGAGVTGALEAKR